MRIVRRLLRLACVGVFLLLGAGAALPAGAQSTTPNEWTWVGGAQATACGEENCNQNPVFGTFGVLGAGNDPGSGGGETWTDSEGNFWLFGSSLWEFNPTTKEWGWMAPSNNFDCGSTCLDGEYGTLGVPAVGNLPGYPFNAMTWTDNSGNLWLFGGSGGDSHGTLGFLNDLWKFFPSTGAWEWVSGSDHVTCAGNDSFCGVPGVYGTLGIPAPGNTPGGRTGGMSCADRSGHLWLFGGQGNDDSTPLTIFNQGGVLNDFWEFDPATTEWTWMGGSDSIQQNEFEPGVYGTLGVPSAGNIPSSRTGGATWVDSGGHFWLFGGAGFLAANPNGPSAGTYVGGSPNDLWEFDPSTLEWTWQGGSDVAVELLAFASPPGMYGTLGVPASGNIPGGRAPAAYWTDKAGNFWLFGGLGYDGAGNYGYLNDLWEFNPSTMLWAWMGGSNTSACLYTQTGNECAPQGVYGTLGTPAAGNVPGGRTSAGSWVDLDGNLWLRGGTTYNWTSPGDQPNNYPPGEPTGSIGSLDDLWEYRPSTTSLPPAATPVFSLPSGDYQSSQTLTISNGMTNASIYYTADGSTPTSNSTLYSGPIEVPSTETVQAIAVAKGYPESGLASATYVFKTYSPFFSQPSGTYNSAISVTISEVIASAVIYYTTDGSTPTSTSTQYNFQPIAVSTSETVKAIAVFNGYSSDVVSVTYTIMLPTFSIATAPGSMTVSAGGSGTTAVTLTPANGFDAAVSFSCSGLPAGATCSFSPATVTPPGTKSTTLTLATSSNTAEVRRGSGALLPGAAVAVAMCCFGLRKRRRLLMLVLLRVSLAGFGVLGGCGGGGSGGGGVGGGSQPVTSTVTVTGTSGTLQQTATFTLTVN